jgi:tetratricopeptide (TPR) repeat protein
VPSKALDDDVVISLVELTQSRPITQRAEYLHRACAGDSELETQVQQYVEWEERMNGFLLESLCPRPVFENPFEPDDLIQGRFRIVREVAQGGMGIVFEAQDEKVGRRVALKCGKAGFRKRLPPEVRHASEISHPNVCKIFDIHTALGRQGETDFFTMEFLDGETLEDRLQRGPLPETEARAIATQVCAGLAEAHRNRVIHGDLKSNNIFLTTAADGTVRAVITDFGLAQAHDPSMRTGTSTAAGTPAYMAPELWQSAKPSIASDIYALGVCLYEMRAGKRPPRAEPGQPTPAIPPVHPKWDPILSRCLDADPRRRFQSAEQIAQALAPPSRRWIPAAVLAVLVALITGLVTYERAVAPTETVRLAMLPLEADGSAGTGTNYLNEATETLTKIRSSLATRLVVIPAVSVVSEGVDSPDKAGAVLGATHALRARLARENGKLLLQAYLTDTRSHVNKGELTAEYKSGQERYLPVALAGMVTSALRLPPLYAKHVVNAAALQDYQAGLDYLRRNSGTDNAIAALDRAVMADPDSPLAHAALAEARWFKYSQTRDSTWLERTRNSILQAQSLNPDLPQVHRVAGLVKADAGQYEAAEAEYLRAIELEPKHGDAWRRLGKVYDVNGKLDQAQAAYLRAVEVDPGMYRNYQDLGAFLIRVARFRDAVTYFERTVQMVPDEAAAHYALGGAYVNAGRYVEGEEELRTAIRMQETAAAQNWLGIALMYQSREAEATQAFLRALQLNRERYISWMYLGIGYRRMDRIIEAAQANRQGLQMAEAELAKNARSGSVRSFLAYLSATLGDPHRAGSEIAQALQLSPGDNNVRTMAVLTYEAVGRRDDTLALLNSSSAEFIADISRWPDLADLHQDSRFKQLLVSRPFR